MSSSEICLFEPQDVFASIAQFKAEYGRCACSILDPWYNKGVGGARTDYVEYIGSIIDALAEISDHIYLWGFPEIVARFVDRVPSTHQLTAWLTWYYKNNPSVIRGWRSAQNACLHLSRPTARLYPEHFLNEAQKELKARGKLRYMPGPTSVIESSLLVGFIGKREQTGHPAQKPVAVYEPLIKMASEPGDLIFDPMCGSGTTGEVCRMHGRRAVLADINLDYVKMTRLRLGI